jgi:catechol 2,3-dioxygenase-like lactoylglutathione lyase family enzyme
VFDHVTIRVGDRAASERFYTTVLRALGIEPTYSGEDLAEWDDFSIAQAGDERPVTQRLHIGFVARSREHVDAFHRAGTEAGHRDDGAPGRRPQYRDDYYGSFLLDPDGNSAEAVHHGALRQGGWIDHLWLRGDVTAAREFYETIAPVLGFEIRMHGHDHLQIVGSTGSFSVVEGTPTEHAHLAFAGSDAVVEEFHRVATRAGYRNEGAPGERPEYHPGYYAAYVLDPGGHNVEVVNHHR